MHGRSLARAGQGVLWGMAIGSFLIFLVLERRLFMRYVNETELQLAIVIILFNAAVGTILGSRALPTRFLAMVIFLNAIVLAFAWFFVVFKLADIELQYESTGMAWAMYTQIVMLTIQIVIMPILLIEWTRRYSAAQKEDLALGTNEAGMSVVALAVAGTLAFLSGIIAELADQWAVLVGCIASAGIAAGVVVLHGCVAIDPARARIVNGPCASDANLFFRDVITTLAIGFPGYAMMERDEFLFPVLVFTGFSMVAFGVAHFLVSHVRKKKGALAVLEGILITIFIFAFWTMIYLYQYGMTAQFISGLPEFITGFALGYFWTRVVHVGEGIQYPKGFPDIPRRGIGQDATAKLVTALLVMLLGVSVAFAISPVDPESIQYVYPVALAIAGLDLFLWTISALKYKD
ncbi:MAG: hypothetical protein Q6365_001330 [Candidatus Sigynarchaeota archaeon]